MEQPTGGEENANDGKKAADHKNCRHDLSSKSKGGEELPPEIANDGKSIATENHNNHKLRKSVHWSEELVTESPLHPSPRQTQSSSSSSGDRGGAATSNPYLAYSSSFNFKNSMVNVKEALGRWRKKVGEASKKAEDLAENTWQHLKTAPSITDAALGRIAQGTKVLAEGGYENIFRQTFDSDPDEHLQNYFACYLSTSAGPVMGVLFVSTAKLAFCSDNPLSYRVDDKTEWSYYKVVVPLHQLKAVNTSSSRTNAAEKYIQVISVDNHEFWYMGFLNFDTALQSLLNTHEFSNFHSN